MAQRKLAAIMFSDIVDYNSLLKEDEEKVFESFRKPANPLATDQKI